jgi:methionine aminotransferase
MISHRTRMIIVNTPHNPTGAVFQQHDLDQLADIVRNSNILLLSDEVYEHITFDGKPHLSITGHKELAERSFVAFLFWKNVSRYRLENGLRNGTAKLDARI